MVHVRLPLAPRRPRPDRRSRVGAARAKGPCAAGGGGGPRVPPTEAAPASAAPRGALSLRSRWGSVGEVPRPTGTPGSFPKLPCGVSVGQRQVGDSRIFHTWYPVGAPVDDFWGNKHQKNRLGPFRVREVGTSCPLRPSWWQPARKPPAPRPAGLWLRTLLGEGVPSSPRQLLQGVLAPASPIRRAPGCAPGAPRSAWGGQEGSAQCRRLRGRCSGGAGDGPAAERRGTAEAVARDPSAEAGNPARPWAGGTDPRGAGSLWFQP